MEWEWKTNSTDSNYSYLRKNSHGNLYASIKVKNGSTESCPIGRAFIYLEKGITIQLKYKDIEYGKRDIEKTVREMYG